MRPNKYGGSRVTRCATWIWKLLNGIPSLDLVIEVIDVEFMGSNATTISLENAQRNQMSSRERPLPQSLPESADTQLATAYVENRDDHRVPDNIDRAGEIGSNVRSWRESLPGFPKHM